MEQVIEKILEIVQNASAGLSALEALILAILAKKVSNNTKAVKTITPIDSSNVEPVSTVVLNPKPIKKQISTEFQDGLTLYFSGRDVESMTEDEQKKYNLFKTYFEEVKKGEL